MGPGLGLDEVLMDLRAAAKCSLGASRAGDWNVSDIGSRRRRRVRSVLIATQIRLRKTADGALEPWEDKSIRCVLGTVWGIQGG